MITSSAQNQFMACTPTQTEYRRWLSLKWVFYTDMELETKIPQFTGPLGPNLFY